MKYFARLPKSHLNELFPKPRKNANKRNYLEKIKKNIVKDPRYKFIRDMLDITQDFALRDVIDENKFWNDIFS
jgi:CRISPR/Cas system CSM-associated protein Csm4 (group 5 of RAMP superfamily)